MRNLNNRDHHLILTLEVQFTCFTPAPPDSVFPMHVLSVVSHRLGSHGAVRVGRTHVCLPIRGLRGGALALKHSILNKY
jgi:hypothetical protein